MRRCVSDRNAAAAAGTGVSGEGIGAGVGSVRGDPSVGGPNDSMRPTKASATEANEATRSDMPDATFPNAEMREARLAAAVPKVAMLSATLSTKASVAAMWASALATCSERTSDCFARSAASRFASCSAATMRASQEDRRDSSDARLFA